MKRYLVFCILIVVMFTFSSIKIIEAMDGDAYIYYNGLKNEISLSNDDLFNDLKGLMPGDEKIQDITFKVRNISDIVTLYLKIDQNNLSYFDIKTYIGDELIGTGNYVRIGSFSENEDIPLKVVIKVPEEMGNEIENLKYDVTWNILAQHDNSEIVNVPKTGDNIFIYILLLILSILMMVFVIFKKLR